jgi:hypothetical protein
MTVSLTLPETEARSLYADIHRLENGQDIYAETYRQLQNHFFSTLTIEELRILLGDQ